MIDASRKFLADEISIIELNGYVSDAWGRAHWTVSAPKIKELLSEYLQLIDQAWNEYNMHDGSFTDHDLKNWIISNFFDEFDANRDFSRTCPVRKHGQ